MSQSTLVLWISSSILLYITANIVPGIRMSSFGRAMLAAVVVGLLNAFVRPILFIITIPLTILTLGLFTFVLNALILRLAAGVIRGFDVDGWWSAIVAAFVMTLLQLAVNVLF